MDKNNALVEQSKNQVKVISNSKRSDIEYIDNKFGISITVNKLHSMMTDITKKEVTAMNINAACSCINQLNETIRTTIYAAEFLGNQRKS